MTTFIERMLILFFLLVSAITLILAIVKQSEMHFVLAFFVWIISVIYMTTLEEDK